LPTPATPATTRSSTSNSRGPSRGSGLPTPRRRTFADAVVAILFGTADAGWVDPHLAWLGAPRSTGFQPVSVHRGGSALPTPHRRTFADAVVASAHSDAAYASPSWLRLAAYAGSRGMANPSLSSCRPRRCSCRPRRCRLSTCTGSVVRLGCTAGCHPSATMHPAATTDRSSSPLGFVRGAHAVYPCLERIPDS
jgi:hypothetical protein